MLGGICGYNKFTDEVYMLETEKKKWTKMIQAGNTPPPVAWHTSTIIKQTMFVIGGLFEAEIFNNDVFVLDLATFSWSKLNLPIGNFQFPYLSRHRA